MIENAMVIVNGVEMDAKEVKKIEKIVARVDSKIGTISKGYMSICGDVAYLRDSKAWLVTGHKNLYEMCAERFGMARGTVSNLTHIYDEYGTDYKLPESVTARKLTELLAEIKAKKEIATADDQSNADGDESGTEGDESGTEGEESGTGKKQQIEPKSYAATLDSDDWDIVSFLQYVIEGVNSGEISAINTDLKSGATIEITVR